MRYFLRREPAGKEEARRFFAGGLLSFVAAFLLSAALPQLTEYLFSVDLFGCLLFLCGAFLWDPRPMKWAILFFGLAFAFRLSYAIISPDGLFSFLWLLPFSLCALCGELSVLKTLRNYFEPRVSERDRSGYQKAFSALPRAEWSFWIATLLSYVSDALVLPAALMMFWVMGLRLWVSYLLFRAPQFVPRRLSGNSSARAQ